MNNYKSRRYYPNDNFDTSINNDYVDVFGRRVTTLEDSDSGDIYVSLTELKRSGFELFEKGSFFRNVNTPVLNRLQKEQFDMYMKMKATKFLSRVDLQLSSNEVDDVIENQTRCFKQNPNRRIEVMNNSGRMQITATVGELADVDTSRNSVNPREHQSRQSYTNRYSNNFPNTGELRRPHRSLSQGRSLENDQQSVMQDQRDFDGNKSYDSNKSNNQQFRTKNFNNESYSPNYHKQKTTNQSHDSSNGLQNRSLNSSNSILKSPRVQVNKVREYGNETSIVHSSAPKPEVRFTVPECSTKVVSNSANFEEEPKSSQISATSSPFKSEQVDEIVSSQSEQVNEIVSSKSERVDEIVSPTRATVVDVVSVDGVFDCAEVVDENTIIGFACPLSYQKELSDLDSITYDSKDDPNFLPDVGDTVAVLKDDIYVRGTITKIVNKQYTCALIDFGVMEITGDVRALPEKYVDIPEFAVVCTGEPQHFQALLMHGICALDVKTPNILTLRMKSPDIECELKAQKWDPTKIVPITSKTLETSNIVYKTVVNLNTLKSNDVVIILGEMDGFLLVRTKECVMVMKQVNEQLKSYQGEALTGTPEINQLCVYSDGKVIYRIQIVEICNNNAVVKCIDYGTSLTVPLSDIKTINKELAEFSNTLIKISLFGFSESQFTSKALDLINDYKAKRQKFTVVLKNGSNVFDLVFSDNSSFSEKLKQLEVKPTPPVVKPTPPVARPTPPVVKPTSPVVNVAPKPLENTVKEPKTTAPVEKTFFFSDLPKCKLTIGKHLMMCTSVESVSDGIATFCSTTDEATVALTEVNLKISNLIETNKQAYQPKLHELCVAEFEGEWYRALVVEIFEEEYALLYVDYGNSSTAEASKIRKITKEIAEIPCISALCILEEVLKGGDSIVEPLLSQIKVDLLENDVYEVDVIRSEDVGYTVTIPALFDDWKSKNLL